MCGPVAQWIRHLTTNQGIPGSNPGGVNFFPQVKFNTLEKTFIVRAMSLFSVFIFFLSINRFKKDVFHFGFQLLSTKDQVPSFTLIDSL